MFPSRSPRPVSRWTRRGHERKYAAVSQGCRVPYERQVVRQIPQTGPEGSQRRGDASAVFSCAGVAYVEVACSPYAAIQNRRPSADKNELRAGIGQRLDQEIEVHRRVRSARPRSCSACRQSSSICHARSSGDRRSCSASRLRSRPKSRAAAARLPGCGLSRRRSARRSWSGVSARNSLTPRLYRDGVGAGRNSGQRRATIMVTTDVQLYFAIGLPVFAFLVNIPLCQHD